MRTLKENETRNVSGGATHVCNACGYVITSGFWYKAPAHVISKHYVKDAGDALLRWFHQK